MKIRLNILMAASLFLGGCVFTPADHVEWRSSQIGTAPGSAIRIGETTRTAIYSRFGTPSYSTQHDMACGYLFGATTGKVSGLLYGTCIFYIGSREVNEMDDIWLAFDANGVLATCEKHLVDRCGGDEEKAWRRFAKAVTDPIRSDQMLNGNP